MKFLTELMYAGLWAINAYGNYRLSEQAVKIHVLSYEFLIWLIFSVLWGAL
jgi:hypothetical protein